MGSTAILAVRIIGDAKDAQKALADLDKSVAASDTNTKNAGKGMSGVWAGVATAMTGCVKAAGNLEQATGAVEQIFGETAPQVMEWAEGMSAYGLSTAQAAQAAAILGGSLASAGIPMEATAVLSTELIELSADLVAVYGQSMPQALSAMGSALRGEYDSLEQFGIFLTADAVAAQAAALTAAGLTFESERQAEAVATLSLIYQQSIPIQSAAEDESASMEATTARLKAEIVNLAGSIGDKLIPIFQPLVDGLGKAIGALADTISESELLAGITETLAGLLEAIAPILESILIPALEALQSIFDRLAQFLDTYVMPILDRLAEAFQTVADAIGVVIGWVEDAIDAFGRFIDIVHEAIDSLTFWNDTYQESAPVTAAPPPAPAVAGHSRSASAYAVQGSPASFNVHVTEEQIYRAVWALILDGHQRNGLAVP